MILPLDDRVAKCSQLAAVSYSGKIVLFGGEDYTRCMMNILSEEGELEKDLSRDPLIPGGMCQGTFITQDKVIYAVGWRKLKEELRWRIASFNGAKWSLL